MRVRITAVVIACPFCAKQHAVPIGSVDAGYVRAPCGRGAVWPVTAIDGADARPGRHRAKEPTRTRATA